MVRKLGQFNPPGCDHLYLDDYWMALGRATGGLRYLPGVIVEHMHPLAGKSENDKGYQRVNTCDQNTHDRDAWTAYRDGKFKEDVARL